MAPKINLREQQKKETTDRIVTAAIRCFGRKGYGQCTLEDIAREAGVTKGLVSVRFGGKEGLLKTAFERVVSSAYHIPPGDFTLEERMARLVRESRQLQEERPEWFEFLYTLVNTHNQPPGIIELKLEILHSSSLYPVLLEAQQSGRLPVQDVDYFFRGFLFTMYNQLAVTRKYYQLTGLDNEIFLRTVRFIEKNSNPN